MSGSTTYTVLVHRHAKADLEAAFAYAASQAPHTALAWLERFHEQLGSLSHHPQRHGLAPEAPRVRRELRQMLFGRRSGVYRVLFLVDGTIVRIVRIRRAAQRPLSPGDLDAALTDL